VSADQTEARLREALLAIRELRARVEADERARSEPIAVVGLGCRLPGGASSPDAYWQLLLDGVDAVTEVPPERWDADALFDPDVLAPGATATRWGGFLEHVDRFDPDFFGISPREAARMDPQQRLLLEVAYEALEDAGETLERLDGSATGVFVGMHNYADDYTRIQLADPDGIDTYTGTGTAQSIAANRLSYVFGFRGPSLALDTACSSSLVAVHLAVQSLRRGECELALAGGVNLMLSPESTIALSRMQLMAADGRCKTFDAGADGFVRGEGCGLVALKRLSDAVEAGDPIRAVIRGSAVNQDGHTNGLTAPSGLAQRDVVRAALSDGAVGPGEIGFVETHGTGTVLGDPIEVEALVDVLGAQRPPGSTCLLGAVKTNLGHLEAAAGVAGLIKAVLAVERGTIPPNLHFSALNPHISFGGAPFVIPTRPMEWPIGPDRRVAGVSSFGWGGTNAHVVLAGPPEPAPEAKRGPAGAPLLVPLSARDPDALRERAAGLRDLASTDQADLASVAYTAAVRRTHHDHRLAVVASSHADLARELDAFLAGEPTLGLATGLVPEQRGGLAFVYAGQGPQSPGMGAQLLEHEPVFNEIVEGCDALVRDLAGWSIVDELRAEASASRLDRTDVNQPVTFALQAGLTALLASWGVVPDVVVGHSAGEVAAAHAAGVLTLEDAVRVAFHRGRLQQQACGTGRMAAVALPSAEVERIVERLGGRLVVAAVNSPGSTTLAGPPDAVEAAVEVLRAEDVFARVLQVDFASHSPAMDELTGELTSALSGLEPRPAHVPVISTVTGRPAEPGDFGPAYWGRNIREPVRFAEAVDGLARAGNVTFLELGPHPVLGAAVSECLAAAGVEGAVLASLRRGQDERSTLLAALANLYVDGQAIDWSAIAPRGDVIRLPAYPWQRRRYWVDGPRRGPSRRGSASGHPLLGGRIRTPLVQEAVVACDLGGADLLERHEAGGLSLLPMSAIVELVLAASGEILAETACGLAGVVVHEPIPLGGAVSECQLVLAPEAEGASFRLYGLASGSEAWTLHAEGKLLTRAAGTPRRSEDASTRRLTVELPAEADARFVVPPALVDAALSALADVLPAVGADRARLAVSFDRLDLVARVDGPVTVTVTPRVSTPDGSAVADVAVEDPAGRPVLRIDGVVLRAVPVEHLRRTEPWQDWLYEVAWRPQVSSPSSGDRLVLVGGGESAGKVAELAEARGAVCARVEDAHSLAEALAASGPGRRRVVWLGGLDSLLDERMSATEVEATSSVPGGALLAVARVLVNAAERETRLWVVTRGGVEAGEVVPDPIQAALWGLGLGIGLEHPEIWGGLVDIDPSVSEFEALLAELGSEHDEDQVAVRSAGRFVPRLVRAAPPVAPEVTWRADAAYLVTGGLGAVGLRVARLAAENGARFLVLTSRRGLPEGVERSSLAPGSVDARRAAAVEEIEQLGAAVRVVACDAADPQQLGRLLDELDAGERPVAGILHAAAAIDPRPLLDLDARSLAEELRAKAGGGWAIDLATRRRALDFVCLFGSTTGLWGSAGLGAYTAANRFLDALARRRRSRGLPALAVDWGLWDEADRLSAKQRAVARAAGLRPMASGEAFSALCRLLGSGTTQIAVADLDWQTLAAVYETRGARPLFAEVREQASRPATGLVRGEFLARLEQAAAHDRQGLLHGHVLAEVARVLGVDPPEALDPTRGFFAMGMDSLTSIELRNRLEIALDRPLAPSLAFNYPTVDALAAHLGSGVLGLPDDSAGVEVNGGADWETLSDDELVALLAQRLEEIG
jgi:acyl transferase domain-containing protein/acyl carrier protein